MKQSENISINASAERVWKAVTDLEDRVGRNDRLHEMSVVGGGALELGSRMIIKVDRNRFKVTVTEFDPPRRMVSGAKNPVMTYFHAYDLSEVGEGVTRLTLTGSMSGALGSLMGLFSKNRMLRDLRDELAPLKEAAEDPTF